MTKYWISCKVFTVQVNSQNGYVVWTAPITRKFIGQPTQSLRRWARQLGGYQEAVLPN